MPTIPRITRQVAPAVAPGPNVRTDQSTLAAAGGAGLGAKITEIAQRERDKADTAAANAAVRDIRNEANERMWGEGGLAYKNGQSMIDAASTAADVYTAFADERLSQLSGRQQDLARPQFDLEFDKFSNAVNQREGAARQEIYLGGYEADKASIVRDASLYGAEPGAMVPMSDGTLDTSVVDLHIEQLRAEVDNFATEHADAIKIPVTDWRKEQIQNAESDMHEAVVSQLLASGQDQIAAGYMAKYGDNMLEGPRAKATAATQGAFELGEIDRAYDTFEAITPIEIGEDDPFARGADILAAMENFADEMDWSPEQTEAALKYTDQKNQRKARAVRNQQSDIYHSLRTELLQVGGDMNQLAKTRSLDILLMHPADKESFLTYAQTLNSGKNEVAEQQAYNDWRRLSITDPNAFAAVDPAYFLDALGENQSLIDKITDLQREVREGTQGGFRSMTAIASSYAEDRLELDPDAADLFKTIAEQEFISAGGKDKVTTLQMQQIVERLGAKYTHTVPDTSIFKVTPESIDLGDLDRELTQMLRSTALREMAAGGSAFSNDDVEDRMREIHADMLRRGSYLGTEFEERAGVQRVPLP